MKRRVTPRAASWLKLYLVAVLVLANSREGVSQSESVKHPVTSQARQSEIRKVLDETYPQKKNDAPAKKEKLAQSLIEVLDAGGLSTDETYVILTMVMALSKETGKFELHSETVGRVSKQFELNSHEFKSKSLIEFLKDCKNSDGLKLAITEANSVALADASAGRFSDANQMMSAADSANKRVPSNAQAKLTIAETRKWISIRETEWKAFQKASVVLAKSPDDPDANWTVGRWHASSENDWKTALPMIAKGTNASWKSASALELKGTTDAASEIAVADAWWDIAQSDNTPAKAAVLKHAAEWYSMALPAASSLQKLRIEKRLNDIGQVPSPIKPRGLTAATAYEDPVEITPPETGKTFAGVATTRFADWNGDGKPDLLICGFDGYVWVSLNTGGKLAAPKQIPSANGNLRVGTVEVTACMADLNGDSKQDLLVSHSDNQIAVFENIGTAQAPRFSVPKTLPTVNGNPLTFNSPCHSRMGAGDWDGDGDTDLLSSGFDGVIVCYRNVGNAKTPKFAEGIEIEVNGQQKRFPHNASPVVFDVDQDGIADVVLGQNWGTITFLIGAESPQTAKQNGPGAPLIRSNYSPRLVSGNEINLRAIAGDNATPTIGDLDGDGILDIVSGGAKGMVWWMRGVASKKSE